MICFELFINGERIGRAGIPGFGVLNTILTEDKPFRAAGKLIQLYHKGMLSNGVVDETRQLCTGTSQEAVSALQRAGDVHAFSVPENVLMQWEEAQGVLRFTDLDEATGVVNQEVRIMPPFSGLMNQYKVP